MTSTLRRAAGPYRVEVDNIGCEHCQGERTWTVVGPDDVAIGQSFDDEEIAEEIAEYMNLAYAFGRDVARAVAS